MKSCAHCRIFFETSHENNLLGAAWELRKSPHMGIEQFKFLTRLPDADAEYVYQLVIDECYSHDDLLKLFRAGNHVAS